MIYIVLVSKDSQVEQLLSQGAGDDITIVNYQESASIPFVHVMLWDARKPFSLSHEALPAMLHVHLVEHFKTTAELRKDHFLLPFSILKNYPKEVMLLLKQLLNVVREQKILEREIKLLKTVETLYLTQEQEKAFSQIIFAVSEILETEASGILYLRDPKKAIYESYFPLEERRKGKKLRLAFHPEYLDEILFSESPFVQVEDPNEKGKILVGYPIVSEQNHLGVLFIPLSKEYPVPDEKLEVASQFVKELASVIENLLLFAETKELTIRDDLTQAFNRRYFEAFIDEELERAKRYNNHFSIIFLDLDDLKQINNRYGHLMGSRTLQEVAKRIQSAVRSMDRVVRFGGDEFCIILPHTSPEEAVKVAQRIRSAIASSAFSLAPNVDVHMTASIGVAGFPEHAQTKEALISKADQAMFEVKSRQKNGIKIAEK